MLGANYFGSIYFGQSYPGLVVGVPEWVFPANHANDINQITQLVFTIPQSAYSIHFEIQIDTANTFNTGSLADIKSWQSQTGWEYYDGASWLPIPATGVANDYAGNQARYTLQTSLNVGTWYRRIRGRVAQY